MIFKITKSVENECSTPGCGPDKNAAVLGMVDGAIQIADQFAAEGEKLTDDQKRMLHDLANMTTNTVVTLQNAVGTFKKG